MERVDHECHREDNTICRFFPFRFLNSVAFNCACDARACVVLHTSESLMMLCTPETRDIINDLPVTEDERMETFQLSDLSVAAFRNDRPIHLLKHVNFFCG